MVDDGRAGRHGLGGRAELRGEKDPASGPPSERMVHAALANMQVKTLDYYRMYVSLRLVGSSTATRYRTAVALPPATLNLLTRTDSNRGVQKTPAQEHFSDGEKRDM